MNDSTLPISKQKQSQRRAKSGRFGLADWTRLLQSTNDLAQRKGQPIRKIRWEEIRQHNTEYDGWIVLKQKVYNIGPYLRYHPGGEDIIKRCLGKDVTQLYERYHRWVNEDGYAKLVCFYPSVAYFFLALWYYKFGGQTADRIPRHVESVRRL